MRFFILYKNKEAKMSVILVDVRYLGVAIRRGRKDAHLQRHE